MYVRMYVCMYVCNVCMYVRIRVCVSVHVYTRARMDAHTQTHNLLEGIKSEGRMDLYHECQPHKAVP